MAIRVPRVVLGLAWVGSVTIRNDGTVAAPALAPSPMRTAGGGGVGVGDPELDRPAVRVDDSACTISGSVTDQEVTTERATCADQEGSVRHGSSDEVGPAMPGRRRLRAQPTETRGSRKL
jgi:hypothetical protein